MRRRTMAAGFAIAVIAAGLATPTTASGKDAPAAGKAGEQSVEVYEGQMGPDGKTTYSQHTATAKVTNTPGGRKTTGPEPAAKPEKVHPLLQAELLQPAAATTRRTVVITFKENLELPKLPSPDSSLPRTAAVNVRALAEADAVVSNIKAMRVPGYQKLSAELAALDVRTLSTFWLINGIVADMPVAAVKALAQRQDVQYVEPDLNGAAPPADADPANDEEDARALMRTDPYFDVITALGQTGGWIGLLDTGVRATHTLFATPSLLSIREDLTGGGNPDDDCWNHGTASAAVISGNSNLGFAFRGVTPIHLDSFKIYPGGCGGLSIAAAVNGFQRAVNLLDRVIVAETQPTGTETDALDTAADAVYGPSGAVVIAAAGNFACPAGTPVASTVRAPALAHKVIGVGAVDVKSQALQCYSGRGPAPDGRTKPDLVAPTNVETASSASDTATQVFTGTSAATPNAAGAAALVRNFLKGASFDIDPGQVYAYLLANTNGIGFNNDSGAGLIRLSVGGNFWRGSVNITATGQQIDIPIAVPATPNRFQVAIWWPEGATEAHDDIDLTVLCPHASGFSLSVSSIFEKVSLAGPVPAGTCTLQIRGFSVPRSPQLVHWVAVTTPA
jgi:serine protease AprX